MCYLQIETQITQGRNNSKREGPLPHLMCKHVVNKTTRPDDYFEHWRDTDYHVTDLMLSSSKSDEYGTD